MAHTVCSCAKTGHASQILAITGYYKYAGLAVCSVSFGTLDYSSIYSLFPVMATLNILIIMRENTTRLNKIGLEWSLLTLTAMGVEESSLYITFPLFLLAFASIFVGFLVKEMVLSQVVFPLANA